MIFSIEKKNSTAKQKTHDRVSLQERLKVKSLVMSISSIKELNLYGKNWSVFHNTDTLSWRHLNKKQLFKLGLVQVIDYKAPQIREILTNLLKLSFPGILVPIPSWGRQDLAKQVQSSYAGHQCRQTNHTECFHFSPLSALNPHNACRAAEPQRRNQQHVGHWEVEATQFITASDSTDSALNLNKLMA